MIDKLLARLGIKARIQPDLLESPPPYAVSKKLCLVCKNMEESPYGIFSAKCRAPQNLRLNRVTGEQRGVWDYCSTHRDNGPSSDLCGRDGAWFVPVEYIVVKRSK